VLRFHIVGARRCITSINCKLCWTFALFPALNTAANPLVSPVSIPQQDSVKEYLTSNVTMLKWMIAEGYGDKRTIARRIAKVCACYDAARERRKLWVTYRNTTVVTLSGCVALVQRRGIILSRLCCSCICRFCCPVIVWGRVDRPICGASHPYFLRV
jgi:hypothetical protein